LHPSLARRSLTPPNNIDYNVTAKACQGQAAVIANLKDAILQLKASRALGGVQSTAPGAEWPESFEAGIDGLPHGGGSPALGGTLGAALGRASDVSIEKIR
jgi:hypothetical protein